MASDPFPSPGNRCASGCRLPARRTSTLSIVRRATAGLLLLAAFACAPTPDKPAPPAYRIGYMICNSPEETLVRFRPLTAYLAEKLGVRLEAVAIDTIDFTKRIDEVDFTHSNSLLYIILHRLHGVEIVAGEKAGTLGVKSQGAIVALKKSNIRTLQDLKGKTMLFGPMYAPTTYLTQLFLLLENNIDPEEDLAFYSIPAGSFKHEKVIYGVLFGKADAGAFPMLDFERMVRAGKISAEDFTVIATGPPIVYCNFGVTQKIDQALAKKFQEVLLGITNETTVAIDGEVVKVLERAQVDGYEVLQDDDFTMVRDMARRTGMPPYQEF